jgi:hypothetical protein
MAPGADSSGGTEQHLGLFALIWAEVERMFDPAFVLTERGYAFVQTWAIKAAHPVLPFAMNFISLMPGLSNGAAANLFPNAVSTLFCFFLNINYSQTRKSSCAGIGDKVGDYLDAEVRTRVRNAVLAAKQSERQEVAHEAANAEAPVELAGAAGSGAAPRAPGARRASRRAAADADDEEIPKFPKVISCVLHSSTPEAFFQRTSGDFEQVKDMDKPHHGLLHILDEAYDLLNAFSLTTDEPNSRGKHCPKVNPHQSALNKLAQYGMSSRATKTCGSFGEGQSPATSVTINGNAHPSVYVKMEREEIGIHVAQCKERFLVATAEPVQPHAPLPEDYTLPAGCARWKWVPLVPAVADVLGLDAGAQSPDSAAEIWKRVLGEQSARPEGSQDTSDEYVPDAEGYEVVLPDGIHSQVRFRRDPEHPKGYAPEWRISNRNFETPKEDDLESAVQRVCHYFEKSHAVIPFTDDAIKLHQSYQAGFNVKCFQNRSAGNVQGGARDGAAPWLLGVLAALLLVFDIFVGVYKGTAEQAGRTLQVTAVHVERAYSLLQVIYRIKEMVIAGEAACKRALDCREGHEAQEAIGAAARAEAAEHSAAAAPMLWSQADFCNFSQMSPTPPPEQLEAIQGEHEGREEQEDEDGQGEEATGDKGGAARAEPGSIAGLEASQGEFEEEPGDLFAATPGVVEAPAVPTQIMTLEDVRAMDYGYGPDGASVQAKLHTAKWTDRAIMKRFFLAGQPRTPVEEICNSIRSARSDGRKALPRAVWQKVMEAGLEDSRIARIIGKGTTTMAFAIKAIPAEEPARLAYHNELMQLCGTTLRELTEALAATSEKKKGKPPGSRGRSRSARRQGGQNAASSSPPEAADGQASAEAVSAGSYPIQPVAS